jgi:hypothetical protein
VPVPPPKDLALPQLEPQVLPQLELPLPQLDLELALPQLELLPRRFRGTVWLRVGQGSGAFDPAESGWGCCRSQLD